jgi:hypothetical protein
MSIELEGIEDQTHGVPSRVTIPISRPQVVYTRPMATIDSNKLRRIEN